MTATGHQIKTSAAGIDDAHKGLNFFDRIDIDFLYNHDGTPGTNIYCNSYVFMKSF